MRSFADVEFLLCGFAGCIHPSQNCFSSIIHMYCMLTLKVKDDFDQFMVM